MKTDSEIAQTLVNAGILRLSDAYAAWDRYRLVKADGAVLGGNYDVVRDWRASGACLAQWPTIINTEQLDMTLDQMLRDPRAICEAFATAVTDGHKHDK